VQHGGIPADKEAFDSVKMVFFDEKPQNSFGLPVNQPEKIPGFAVPGGLNPGNHIGAQHLLIVQG
jgi:hypothetical protein